MLKQFVNFVIRPPRAEYNPDQYLWEAEFTVAGRKYKRQDLELRNGRGHGLQCSHYVPSPFPENTLLPCVIYCHGNSGCRADANDAAVFLLPSNITVFTLDFSGSGLSDGDYVSLGWHEKDDLKTVVSFLRSNKQVSRIGLWGRSMGAVTSLLYGAEDPSIAGMVLDSPFCDLFDLMMELVDYYKIRLPKFTVKLGIQYMRRVIQKKAKFDIMALNCIEVAPTTFIPALFGHATEDLFIKSHHSDLIFKSYAGDKNMIKFEGDHNSRRPQFYYDSVSIFFYNVLHPPQSSSACSNKLEKYCDLAHVKVGPSVDDLGHMKVGANVDEKLLFEIITSLHTMGTDAPSSSSAPSYLLNGATTVSNTSSVGISRSRSLIPFANGMDTLHDQGNTIIKLDRNDCDNPPILQDKENRQNEDYYSLSSSNRESWGRCSSLGGESDEEFSFPKLTENASFRNQMTLKALAMPPRSILPKSADKTTEEEKVEVPAVPPRPKRNKFEKWEAEVPAVPPKPEHDRFEKWETEVPAVPPKPEPNRFEKWEAEVPAVPPKPERDRFERLEALSQRLCLSKVLKRVNHRRNRSS